MTPIDLCTDGPLSFTFLFSHLRPQLLILPESPVLYFLLIYISSKQGTNLYSGHMFAASGLQSLCCTWAFASRPYASCMHRSISLHTVAAFPRLGSSCTHAHTLGHHFPKLFLLQNALLGFLKFYDWFHVTSSYPTLEKSLFDPQ